MALFEGARRVPDSRSHSRLVVSEGFSPAERWITDPSLKALFEHHYGGPGYVVIPKGTIVTIKDPVYDYEVGRYVNVMSICDGTSDVPCGVAPYNIYQRVEGRLYHNFPSLITRNYIEVPYMANIYDVYTDPQAHNDPPAELDGNNLKMRWGCAYRIGDGLVDVKAGDFLTADRFGKFIKLDSPGANWEKVVGQVLAVETDMPPTGWLKWLDWAEEDGERADDQNRLPYPSDPSEGRPWTPDYKWPLTPDYRGIPGMTDGAEMGTKKVENETESSRYTTDDSKEDHEIPSGSAEGTTVVFRLENFPVIEDSVTVEVNLGSFVEADGKTHVDNDAGWVYYTVSEADAAVSNDTTPAAVPVRVTYEYHDLDYLGVPAAWDFKGSLGAVRILMKL